MMAPYYWLQELRELFYKETILQRDLYVVDNERRCIYSISLFISIFFIFVFFSQVKVTT